MGYRSEVVIAMAPSTYEAAPEEVKKAFIEMFMAPASEDDEEQRIIFADSAIKWYDDFPEVKLIESWLRGLPDDDYGFMRLGEDSEDVQSGGIPWDWGINHISRLEY